MHRASPLSFRCGCCGRLRIQSHSTLRTWPRPFLPHFRTHRTNVDPSVGARGGRLAGGWSDSLDHSERYHSRSHGNGRGRENFFWICLELGKATGAAEEVVFALILGAELGRRRVDFHPANGISDLEAFAV